jgi:hypothetical protein
LLDIDGSGPQVAYTSPEATPVTKTWDTATSAKAIVQELIGTVDWQIVEWVIPAFRVATEKAEPFSVAVDIVRAAGGIIDPEPEGGFTVRYVHPVAATAMDGNESFEFVTQDNILRLSENSNIGDYFDKVRVVDVETGQFNDSIEYDEQTQLLTAYPSPWDQSAYVTVTRDDVSLHLQSIATKETTERIEFFAGEAQTSHPVYLITNILWVSLSYGGGIAFGTDSTVLTATGGENFYGIADVTYTSRVIEYKVTATNVDVSQFLLNRE